MDDDQDLNPEKPQAEELLIVEDLQDTIVGLTLELEYRSLIVHHATSRSTASDMLSESRFAAVLIDLNIPSAPGQDPSPDHGRGLAVDMCSGVLGPLNTSTPFMIMTAQQIELRPADLGEYANFLGTGSKVGDSRWLTQRLTQIGVGEQRSELDLGMDEPRRERVQVVVTDAGNDAVVAEVPDLGLMSVKIAYEAFTPYLRRQLRSGRRPIVLWAIGNVAAAGENDLDLKEFTLSEEQVSPTRNYDHIDWLDR